MTLPKDPAVLNDTASPDVSHDVSHQVYDEAKRRARLRMLGVLDTAPEPIFESLARLASTICGTPIALVSLLDGERQWFKANIGLHGVAQTDQKIAFCEHAIQSSALMEVADAQADPRFAANPLVTGAPHVRFYAGVPLVMPGGESVGTLCVIDREVRQLSVTQRLMLHELAQSVTQALLLREKSYYPEISGDEERFRVISEASPQGIFQADMAGGCTYTNPRWREIYRLAPEHSLGTAWWDRVHPEDHDKLVHDLKRLKDSTQAQVIEHRLLHANGEVTHVYAKARMVTWGEPPQRGLVGSVEDVTQRKLDEARLRASNDFLDRAERIAGVGGYELDLRTRKIQWTAQMRRIYEMDTTSPDFQPSYSEHVPYFDAAGQKRIEETAAHALRTGQPWDIELPMVTAKGRAAWVRSVGRVEYDHGKPVRMVGTMQDITGAKTAEAELKQANRLLRSVLDNLPCGVSVFNSDLHLVAHNVQFQTMMDLPDSLINAPVFTFESMVYHNAERGYYGSGKDPQRAFYGSGTLQEVVAGIFKRARAPASHHFQRTQPNGLTLDIRGEPMPGGGFITVYTDISAAKTAELSLLQSQERLQRALVASRLALWDADVQSRTVYFSDTWSELMGDPSGPMVVPMRALFAQVPDEDRSLIERAFGSIVSGQTETYSVEHRVYTLKGTLVWVHSEGRVIERNAQGQVMRATGTNRDITERKRAEEHLRHFAAITSATLEATADGIVVINDQRELVLCNQHFLDMLGVTDDADKTSLEAMKKVLLQQVTDPERLVATTEAMYASAQSQTQEVIEFKNGRVLERYSKLHMLDGRAIGRVWSYRDVTAARAAELELKNAKASAEAANLAKTAFLSTMSHEIRTPLNGILGMTQLLLDEPLSPQQAQFAQLIDASAQSLLVLVNDFLDLAKIDSGLTVLENAPFDLNALLAEMAALFGYRASAKSLVFRHVTAPDVPRWVSGDAPRLRQVLNNLLGNALKFTPSGELSLDVSCVRQPDGYLTLRFCVADTGIGIATGVQKKLFTRFVQADTSTTRKYGGTGLGLAIVKQLSELMGGHVELVSEANQGSAFTVVLPNVREAAPSLAWPGLTLATAPPDGQAAKILLVEDNPTNQIVAMGLLKKIGYTHVTLARNGQEAVDRVLGGDFAMVLMDCQMPLMDGYVATRILRAKGCTLPIIAMTANAMAGDTAKCLDAGMNDYLAKPVTQALLATSLSRWIGHGEPQAAATVPAVSLVAVQAGADDVMQGMPDEAADGAVDDAAFDRASVMDRLGDDLPLIAAVITSFTQRAPEILQDLETALLAQDETLAARQLHSLLGASAAVSASHINKLVFSMEQRLKAGELTNVRQMLPLLARKFDAFALAVTRAGF